MSDLNNFTGCVSVPLRQCLVMSVVFGESHQLPAGLFSAELISRAVMVITGEMTERIFVSSSTNILLVFATEADVNRIKVQLENQSSWMGQPVHLKCVRPSGREIRQFGVVGTAMSPVTVQDKHLRREGDISLELPFFSGQDNLEEDEVDFDQWLHAVEGAVLTSSTTAVHSWILRSVREPAASNVRSLGVGTSIDNILLTS